MSLSALDDESRAPDAAALAAVLGGSSDVWHDLESAIQESHGPLAAEWHFAGAKYGWSLRLKKGKRTVIYLIPGSGCFLAGLVFGEKAVAAIRRSRLPREMVAQVEAAKPYAEGRGVRFEVRTKKDLPAIVRLVAIKMEPA